LVRSNPALRAFRDRLVVRAKKAEVMVTARTEAAGAVIRTGNPWGQAMALAARSLR
jgi:hypothetical protein